MCLAAAAADDVDGEDATVVSDSSVAAALRLLRPRTQVQPLYSTEAMNKDAELRQRQRWRELREIQQGLFTNSQTMMTKKAKIWTKPESKVV